MSAIVISHALPSERNRLLKTSAESESEDESASPRDYGAVAGGLESAVPSGSALPADESTPLNGEMIPLKYSISKLRFVALCAGIWSSNFAFAFQATAVTTLAPAISTHFNHAELAAYLGSIFTLANTAGIPLYGVFMETLGRKMAMVTACTFFGIGTIFCALAPSMYWLIAARAFAGLGGGGLLTVSAVICTDLVPLRDRGHYQGIMMTIFGLGTMIGGPLSGWLSDQYGWHWAFWVQIPVIIICILVVSTLLPEQTIPPTHQSLAAGLRSLDYIGTLLLLISVSSLILGLSFHTSYLKPWSDPLVYGLLVLSVVAGTVFVWVEGKVKRPLIPLSLFTDRQLVAIYSTNFFLSVVSSAFLFQVPFYFAVVMNASAAVGGGVISLSSGLANSIGTVYAGRHIRKGGNYKLLGVLSLFPASISAFIASRWQPSWPLWTYYLTIFPSVLGYSIFLCVGLIALISSVDSKTMPKATALLYTTRSLGGTLGVSIASSIQLSHLSTNLRQLFSNPPNPIPPTPPYPPIPPSEIENTITAILHSKTAIYNLPAQLQPLAVEAYGKSLSSVWWILGFTALVTVSCSLWIREVRMPEKKKIKRKDVKGVAGGVQGR